MNPGGMVGLAATEVFRLMVRPPVQERDRLRETGKFLSFVLRHRPDSIGLTLDAQGWASVDALVAAANAHGHPLDAELLHQVVSGSDKQRFALSADGSRIRANQGHSVEVDLGPRWSSPRWGYSGLPICLCFREAAQVLAVSPGCRYRRLKRHSRYLDPIQQRCRDWQRHPPDRTDPR
jgi:hypothetical protein